MCQYDTDAPAQGYPHPQKLNLKKKGYNSNNNWQILS